MKQDHGAVRAMHDSARLHFVSHASPLIDAVISHAEALQTGADAEILHQLRVALRRLRSLFWAYGPLFEQDFGRRQRAFFQYLADEAGQTRNWDILIELLEKLLQGNDAVLPGSLRRVRSRALNSSRKMLSHPDIKPALRSVLREASKALSNTLSGVSLAEFAHERLALAQKSLRKARRHAAHAGASDYTAWHDVRKAGKKLRYLLEFFEPLLEKKQRKSIKGLEKLQKQLGILNDVVASETLLQDNPSLFPDKESYETALAAVDKERRRQLRKTVHAL